jgi:DNA-binding MarR family transcriptional regulator
MRFGRRIHLRAQIVETSDSTLGVELLRLTRRCRGIDKYVSSSVSLTIDEMHCLSALFLDQPPSAKRLSELLCVDPSRTSRLLNDLEQRGFVLRARISDDRRIERVQLTENGSRTVRSALALFSEVAAQLATGLRTEFAAECSWLLRMLAPDHFPTGPP